MANAKKISKKRTKNKDKRKQVLVLFIIVVSFIFIVGFLFNELLNLKDNERVTKDTKEPTQINQLERKNQELLTRLQDTLKQNESIEKELKRLANNESNNTLTKELQKLPEPPKDQNRIEAKLEVLDTKKEEIKIAQKPSEKETNIIQKQFDYDELSEAKDFEKTKKLSKIVTQVKEKKEKLLLKENEKSKLVIIIDDVSTKAQLDSIKSLGLKVTPSIFPPFYYAPNSEKLAMEISNYMIHLPLEAYGIKDKYMLKTTNTLLEIESKIKAIRALFPDAKFINNHTGSKFTENEHSMEMLFEVLNKYGFIFVDSKTTPNSKTAEIAQKHGIKYFHRDVFLDNEPNVEYIKSQLKEAIKKAKEYGYAIAIGHPHSATFRALKESKEILEGVDVVYINELENYFLASR